MKRLTPNQKNWLNQTITIRWTTSRGRDSYGYTVASLRDQRGRLMARCNGGGYDMRGTVLGHFIAGVFHKELLRLRPQDMPANSHWQHDHTRICDGDCKKKCDSQYMEAVMNDTATPLLPRLDSNCFECPVCKGPTRDSGDGKQVDDGRYFYGLTYHDPDYDPGKAVIGKDCSDRTFSGKSEGKTVEQAEKDGDTVGLERYQAFYSASSKVPSRRHRAPLIDGACGVSSVMNIANAIGLSFDKVHSDSKTDVYQICKHKPSK